MQKIAPKIFDIDEKIYNLLNCFLDYTRSQKAQWFLAIARSDEDNHSGSAHRAAPPAMSVGETVTRGSTTPVPWKAGSAATGRVGHFTTVCRSPWPKAPRCRSRTGLWQSVETWTLSIATTLRWNTGVSILPWSVFRRNWTTTSLSQNEVVVVATSTARPSAACEANWQRPARWVVAFRAGYREERHMGPRCHLGLRCDHWR